MGRWNTHGMVKDVEVQQEAVDMLGFFPEELASLSDYCRQQSYIWTETAKYESGQKKRKATLIAKFYQYRSRRWKELAAWAEHEYQTEIDGQAKERGSRAG